MDLTEELIVGSSMAVRGETKLEYQGVPIDLTPPWRRVTMAELVLEVRIASKSLHPRSCTPA